MPYIKQELREELSEELNALKSRIMSMIDDPKVDRAGILNYVITDMLDTCYGPLSDAKYRDYNEAIGMLECCKLEFYRKAAAPYEDIKEKQNGKVLDGKVLDGKVLDGKVLDGGSNGNAGFGLAGKDLTRQQPIPENLFEHGLKLSSYPVGTFSEEFKRMRELIYPSNEVFDNYVVFKLEINKNLSLFILGSSREDAEEIMNNWLKAQSALNSDSLSLSYIELGDITGYFNFYKNFCDLESKIKNIFLAKGNKEIPKIILFLKNKKKLIRKV